MRLANLIGCWKLRKMDAVDADGKYFEPWGTEIDGILIYHESGYVTLQMVRTDSLDYRGYYGTYQLDDTIMSVVHKVRFANPRQLDGSHQKRSVLFDKEILMLTSPLMILTERQKACSVMTYWERV